MEGGRGLCGSCFERVRWESRWQGSRAKRIALRSEPRKLTSSLYCMKPRMGTSETRLGGGQQGKGQGVSSWRYLSDPLHLFPG